MALKVRLRSKHSKRLGYVPDSITSKSTDINISSSDSEVEKTFEKNKVREELSIKNLMKKRKTCGEDGDHIYSSGKAQIFSFEDTYKSALEKKKKFSSDSNDKPRRQRCFSKNALMARLNRERKKKYVSSLESENGSLRKQNDELKKTIENHNSSISALKYEILYLKGLLANSKELNQILQNLKSTTNLPVTSSIIMTGKNNICSEECKSVIKQLNQPKIRSVKNDCNFPIMDKDINLGSTSNKSFSCSGYEENENLLLNFENDYYQNFYEDTQNSILNLNSLNLDLELDSFFKSDEARKDNIPEVGICLHVNNKRLSVEICPICNDKANSSMLPPPDNVF